MNSQTTKKDAILKNFSVEHSDLVHIGYEIGADNLDKILQILGGSKVHLPTSKCFWRKLSHQIRDEAIRRDFTGFNLGELQKKYGLHKRHIRRIVNQ